MVVYLQNSLAAPRHQIRAAWHDHDKNFSLSAVQCLASLGDHLVEGVVVEQPGVVPRARALPAKQWQDMVWWKFLSLPVSSSRNSAHLHRVTGRTSHSTEVRVRDEGGLDLKLNIILINFGLPWIRVWGYIIIIMTISYIIILVVNSKIDYQGKYYDTV